MISRFATSKVIFPQCTCCIPLFRKQTTFWGLYRVIEHVDMWWKINFITNFFFRWTDFNYIFDRAFLSWSYVNSYMYTHAGNQPISSAQDVIVLLFYLFLCKFWQAWVSYSHFIVLNENYCSNYTVFILLILLFTMFGERLISRHRDKITRHNMI